MQTCPLGVATDTNGQTWEFITEAAFGGLGRGGHAMLVIPDRSGAQQSLWVIGGRGGDNTGRTRNFTYFNDIWTSPFDDTRIPKVCPVIQALPSPYLGPYLGPYLIDLTNLQVKGGEGGGREGG